MSEATTTMRAAKATEARQRPRLCFVGPMIGRNKGQVTTQGERLADYFTDLGYPVFSTSSHPNRYVRGIDITLSVMRKALWSDVMVLQVFGGPSFIIEDAASLLGRFFGLPIVMVMRGGAMPEFCDRYPGWTQRVLSRATAIVTPSGYLAADLDRRGFRTQVIPNTLDLAAYPHRHRRVLAPRLLWMRAFHPAYNPELALRAFALVLKEFPEATLVMGGALLGDLEGVKRLAQEMGLSDSVTFPGFLDMAGKAREGKRADLFLNTNRIDNMPVSVVEAGAMGLPVVATNVGGIPFILQNEVNAMLTPDDDAPAFAAAICRLLREPDLAAKLSTNGRRLAEECAWENIRPQWEQLFERVSRRAL